MLEEEEKESWADEERALCESLPLFQSFLGGLDVAKICQVVQQDFNKMVAFISLMFAEGNAHKLISCIKILLTV